MRSAGIEGEAAEIREDLAELYVKAENLAMDEDSKSGKAFVERVAKRIAGNMARLGTVRDGETQEAMAERLRREILARTDFSEPEVEKPAKASDKEARAQHKIVRQAERLYLKAAEAAGNNAIQKMILSQVPELEEEVLPSMNEKKMQVKVQHSLKIQYADGTVEELADARNLTNEQAVDYLTKAKKGELRRSAYIPVRKDTPAVIAETLKQVNEKTQMIFHW